MVTLKGESVYLRALEPNDFEVLYAIENDESLWGVSETLTPFSQYSIKEYLVNAHRDIYEVKQLRLVVCNRKTDIVVGLVDLFDFDPLNLRAGIGILVAQKDNRGKGIGKEVLSLIIEYASKHLQLHQLYANIGEENTISIALFEKQGFELVGVKKDWRRSKDHFINELLYQRIL